MGTERARIRSRQQTRRRFLTILGWTIVLLASSLFVVLIRFIVHPRLDTSKGLLANLLYSVRTRIKWRQPIGHDRAKRKRLARRAIKPFLSTELGLPQSDDLSNVTAYWGHWLKVLERDHTAIFTAASAASKAVDFIWEFSHPNEEEVESEELAVA